MARSKKVILNNRNLISQTDPMSVNAEEYRNIRTNIEFSSFDSDLKTLLVTSANPSEGKSTTTANLAIVFAQHGKRVLLIDADLRKPTVHFTFRCENYKGLTNLLTKQAKMEEVIIQSSQDNLFILPSGPTPPNPSKLLASENLDRFLQEASEYFDLILFDTPPLLPVADAKILMSKINGVVLVVRSNKTELKDAQKAIDSIKQVKGNLLGLVLNDKKQTNTHYYAAYGN